MTKSVIFALSFVAMTGSAAMAQTAQEQAACRPDAKKFCSSHIGKPAEMKACLSENKANLSEACLKVVVAHGG